MIQRRHLLDLAIPFLALGLVILANFHPAQAQDPNKHDAIQVPKVAK